MANKRIRQNLISGTQSQLDKSEGFIAAAQSDKYTYAEIEKGNDGLANNLIERTVQNLGEGFESEVTFKSEYSISYSYNEEGKLEATSTLTSQTYYSLFEKDGQYFNKIVTINYEGKNPTLDITYKQVEQRTDNTKNLHK